MEKLRLAGLYMSSLVSIKGDMIERYNRCLVMLGIEPTNLTSISIDSIGWSPEVAEEKQNLYYLNHGGANPFGIILSPQQEGKPVYFPYHSFDRGLVNLFFTTNRTAIADITLESAIIINLDQHIDAFYEPSDLIDYDSVTVGFEILDKLDAEQEKQLQLVEKMYHGNNCLNMNLHSKLLASAKNFGDLRTRKLQLEEVDYQTTSFYTKAFGGVFVLRSNEKDHLLIFEDEAIMKEYDHGYSVMHIGDPVILETLVKHDYLHFDIAKISQDRVTRITQRFLSEYLREAGVSVAEVLENKSLYLKHINLLSVDQKKNCIGPQKYLDKLNGGQQPDRSRYLSDAIYLALHSPANKELESLLWLFICRMQPIDPYLTYYYDKELFYIEFASYPPSYQDWIIQVIQEKIRT